MKILQSTIRYSPAVGGVEEYVKNISERLAGLGHSVKVFCSDLKEYDTATRINEPQDFLKGVQTRRFKTIPWRVDNYAIMPSLFPAILKQRVDLIHAHCFMYFPFDAAVTAARLKGIPLVINPYLSELGRPSLMGKFYRKILGKLAVSADAVIAISEYEKTLIKKWGFRPKRLEIIHPGVDLNEFAQVKNDFFHEFGLEDKKILLFVGRLDRNKGVDLLIKAMPLILKEIPDSHLVIIGPDCGFKEELKWLGIKTKVNEKVIFLSNLKREKVIAAMKSAALLILPSRYEAFGIVLIEAMAARLPVLATNHSAIPGVINNGIDGLLFSLDNYTELAQKAAELIKNEKLRNQIIETAWQKVKNNFDWDKSAKKMEEIYLSLRNGK